MFNLNEVDWIKCEIFALSNQVKEVCDYWNNKEDWETTTNLMNKFNLNKNTIIKYLKQGAKLGWCNYNSKKEQIKINKSNGKKNGKSIEIFKNNISLGVFESMTELEKQSEELFGVKLLHSSISKACNNGKPYKGFGFKYYNI